MEKQIFKIGDRVFDIDYGWGEVKEAHYQETTLYSMRYPILVKFQTSSSYYTLDGKWAHGDSYPRLSFTEYDFVNGGFSQERPPINYEEYIGKWGKFWDTDNPKYFTIGILKGYEQDSYKPFQSVSLDFKNFKPLTDEQIKVLGLKND